MAASPFAAALSGTRPHPEYRALGFSHRIALLAVLFVFELSALSVWLDAGTFLGHGWLSDFIGLWGARLLQSTVVCASLAVTFSYLRARPVIHRLSTQLTHMPLAWGWLLAHTAAMTCFAALCARLFVKTPVSSDAMAALWLASGLLGILFASITFLPVRAWVELFRETGSIWLIAAPAGFVVSLLSNLGDLLWYSAASATFTLVNTALRFFLSGVESDPATRLIGTARFSVTIEPQCSGLEGVGLILVFSAAWLWFFRRECRFPHALLVIPVGVAAMWLLNVARITALVLIGNAGAPGVAAGGFHSQAGWLSFNGVALGLSLAFRRVPWFLSAGTPALSRRGENPTAAYLMPLLSILGAAMVARAVSNGFEWLYPLRFAAAAAVLWTFRRSYARLDWGVTWIGPAAGVLVFALWLGLDPAAGVPTASPIADGLLALSPAARMTWLVFRTLAAVVTVPIAEELAFRGFLIRRMLSPAFEDLDPKAFTWLAIAASSLAFGAMHGGHWIAGTLAGLVYAGAFLRRGKVGDAVVAHAVTNALLALWVVTGGRWYLW